GAAERIPELGARFYENGPLHGHAKVKAFLEGAVARGLLDIPDPDLASYQLSELCLAGLLRQRLFGYRRQSPAQAEIEQVVKSGVNVFLKAYGTELLVAQEQARAGG
ncbi:TetR/AcrR family transcriptional regulator C-terminal domain-containing protein, partial [Klebsiella pneumoniae]|uniref:TetR/AcrR family transcriptional regulator C-terminal domain-containing protein n=1 Tax=Klebsiella pneumoniae TaxID=573 RepID=UPI003D6A7F58